MSPGCERFCADTDRFFDARVAARELRRYRRKGPGVTARLLRDGIRAHAGSGTTLIDIGAGVGAVTFELVGAGVERATVVEVSSAYLDAVREEAARRRQDDRVERLHGDFVSVASRVPAADIVTLDRVVCCHPAVEPLLEEAATHARRCLACSYPRDRWPVRAVVAGLNSIRRLMRRAFPVFVHSPSIMEALVRRHGFRLVSRRTTFVWCADVYVRDTGI